MVIFDTLQQLYLSENDIEINMTANADFIALEVLVDGQMVGARLHVPPTNSKATINVKSMIHAELIELENSIVSLEETTRIRKPVECKVRAAVVAGGTTGAFTDSSTFKVMLGKIVRHTFDWYADVLNIFDGDADGTTSTDDDGSVSVQDSSGVWLSSYPNYEKVAIDQPQFISLLYTGSTISSNLTVEVLGAYSNGSTATNSIAVDLTNDNLEQYDTLIIRTTPNQLGIATDDLTKFYVYVAHNGTPISEGRNYKIKSTPDQWRDILYFNEYYAPHTLRLTGEWSKQLQTDYLRYETETGIHQDTQTHREAFTAKSSFLSKDESEALEVLYKRGKLFWLDGDYVVLMLLDKNKWLISRSFQFLYVLNLAMTASNDGALHIGQALFVNGVVDIPSDGTPPPSEDPPLEEETE